MSRNMNNPSMMPHRSYGSIETSDASCFLCGEAVDSVTQEHLFPKWLQQRHNLWDQRLVLLNQTTIEYRNLRIPCCLRCNGKALSQLETTIRSAVTSGYEAAVAVQDRWWYLWAGKIFFGILRKELKLLGDRARPSDGTIISESTLKSFSNLHLFLQGIRGKHEFSDGLPYSVLICNLHDLGGLDSYCFRDNLSHMTLSMRMGDIGLIVALEDGGLTTTSYGRYVRAVRGRKLHPIQFDELYVRSTYQVSLVRSAVKYVTAFDTDGSRVAKTDVYAASLLDPWSQEEFSKGLRAHLSYWQKTKQLDSDWFVAPNLTPTWMADDSGEPIVRPLSAWQLDSSGV